MNYHASSHEGIVGLDGKHSSYHVVHGKVLPVTIYLEATVLDVILSLMNPYDVAGEKSILLPLLTEHQ